MKGLGQDKLLFQKEERMTGPKGQGTALYMEASVPFKFFHAKADYDTQDSDDVVCPLETVSP